jgi:hypothetical protein
MSTQVKSIAMSFDINAVAKAAKQITKRKSNRFGNAVYQALIDAPNHTMSFDKVYGIVLSYDIAQGTFDKNPKYYAMHDPNTSLVKQGNVEMLMHDAAQVKNTETFVAFATKWQYLNAQLQNKLKVLCSPDNLDNKSNIRLNAVDYAMSCQYANGNFKLVAR